MIDTRSFLRRAALAVGLAAQATLASAAAIDTAEPAPTPTPLTPEQLSLQGFGAQAPACLEWGDSCSICRRDEADAMHCSTPGIACQPEAIVCKQEKTK